MFLNNLMDITSWMVLYDTPYDKIKVYTRNKITEISENETI